jgi:hypothetical protein
MNWSGKQRIHDFKSSVGPKRSPVKARLKDVYGRIAESTQKMAEAHGNQTHLIG